MSLTPEGERFLDGFAHALRTLPSEVRDDVVAEVRSHLVERMQQGHPDAVEAFGSPEAYARTFLAEWRLQGTVAAGTPWRLLSALLRSSTNAFFLLAVFVPLLVLQLAALTLVVFGLLRPLAPGHIGLFYASGHFLLGAAGGNVHPRGGLLGPWTLPVFVTVGLLLLWSGRRALLAAARWRVRVLRGQQ
jgi:uncharacterized membrane protein